MKINGIEISEETLAKIKELNPTFDLDKPKRGCVRCGKYTNDGKKMTPLMFICRSCDDFLTSCYRRI